MVTNYLHPIESEAVEPAADGARAEAVGVLDRVRQMMCGLHGHDNLLQFEQDRMYLRCVSCGHETPGWSLTEAPPIVTARPATRRQAVIRPQLVSARKIA